MKVIGYTRVSTQGQAVNGAGLAAQRRAIEAECERLGAELVDVVAEQVSGGATRMPLRSAAVKRIEAGEAEMLMAAKLDRFSRGTLDFGALADRARKKGWKLACLDLGLDTSTPFGEAMATVAIAFAQLERRLIGERTKTALAVKRQQGVKLGRPSKVPDVVRALIRNYRSHGESYQSIARKLNERGTATGQGGKRWYAATVRKVELGADSR